VTTPLPSTPGDQREDRAQAVADAVAAVYGQAELVLIATIAAVARRVAAGVMVPTVARRKVAQAAQVVFDAAAPRIRSTLDATIDWAPHTAQLAHLLDQATDTAMTSAQNALTAALPSAEPLAGAHGLAVQRAVDSTRSGLPGTSLSLSRIQAAQKALDDLAAQGITGFVDRSGRRWDLTAYVEMVTRTAISNAWDDLQAAAIVRSGLDLIRVSTHSLEGSCAQCRPWLGRILSLTGGAGHPSLAAAKAAGFRHPNCRCFWAPLGAGVAADVVNPVALDQAAAVYRASQRQRALEREVRKAGRRAHAAIIPAARAAARRDLATARAASDAHRRSTGLRMTQVGMRRREHPFAAH
jgi:hypothetical protein